MILDTVNLKNQTSLQIKNVLYKKIKKFEFYKFKYGVSHCFQILQCYVNIKKTVIVSNKAWNVNI